MNPEMLLSHFDRISDAPDAIPHLRRFILDLAMRGKLVEQDSNDEPASELLKRIRAEKARLVREGTLKNQVEQASELVEGEQFVSPPGWVPTTLGEVSLKITDGAHKTPTYIETGVPFISVKDFSGGSLDFSHTRFIPPEEHAALYQRCDPRRGDILIGRIGTLGKAVLVNTDREFSLFVSVGLIRFNHDSINPIFFRLLLNSPLAEAEFNRIKVGGGTHTNKLNLGDLHTIFFPLPPLAEQHRIVAKVDELMALCDRLEAAQAERENRRSQLVAASLNQLNQPAAAGATETFREHAQFYLTHLPRLTTRPEHIKQLRQTILNLAVRGRLVPQDPKDEPACELLKRIHEEKQRLVNEGKIRRQSLLSEVEPGDMPFFLPNRWAWVRLGDVIHLVSGQHLQPGEYSDQEHTGPPYITGPADFGNHGLVITRYAVVRKAVAKEGQILLTVKGAGVGKTAICDLHEVAISRQLMALTAIGWNQRFLLLTTHRLAEALKESARSLIPGISREDVEQFIFALPPTAEQHRIVAKVDELMALCDRLEEHLTTAQTETRRLLESVLHLALNGKASAPGAPPVFA